MAVSWFTKVIVVPAATVMLAGEKFNPVPAPAGMVMVDVELELLCMLDELVLRVDELVGRIMIDDEVLVGRIVIDEVEDPDAVDVLGDRVVA